MQNTLADQRILLTQAQDFMGPALADVFEEQGATVLRSSEDLSEVAAAQAVVDAAGDVDVLVANLSFTAPTTAAVDVDDLEWRAAFAALVDP